MIKGFREGLIPAQQKEATSSVEGRSLPWRQWGSSRLINERRYGQVKKKIKKVKIANTRSPVGLSCYLRTQSQSYVRAKTGAVLTEPE